MNIVAIESAGASLNIAVKTDTGYAASTGPSLATAGEAIIPRIASTCAQEGIAIKDLDMVACGRGPGSFTSLRVGMATAKGLCSALSIPLVSIGTLDIYHYPVAMAHDAVAVVLDARKQRFYCALFHHGVKVTDDLDIEALEFVRLMAGYAQVFVTGPDARMFAKRVADDEHTSASVKLAVDPLTYRDYGESLIALALQAYAERGADDSTSGPVYIRKSDAELALEAMQAHQDKEHTP